jgi:competence protein ComEC
MPLNVHFDSSFTDRLMSLRGLACKRFVVQFRDSNTAAVATALVVGEELPLSKEVEQAYANTGTLHILCVSGMHVGLLFALLGFLTGFLRTSTIGRWIRYPSLLTAVWAYACIAGLAPSILRAAVMFTFFLLNEWSGRKSSGLNALFSALFVLLIWNPYQLFEPGLQLSFLAVFGIMVYQRTINRYLPSGNWFYRRLSEAISVTLSAQLLATPFSLGMFGKFPNYFLPANLVVVPVTTLAVYTCALQVLLPESFPLHSMLVDANKLLIDTSNYLVSCISTWPCAITDVSLSLSGVLTSYIVIACITRWMFEKRFFWLLCMLVFLLLQMISSLVMQG